jgi:hypothetical protein
VIARYLGADSTETSDLRMTLPTDTAPHPMQLLPGPPDDTLNPDTVAGDSARPPRPTPLDTSHEAPDPGTR